MAFQEAPASPLAPQPVSGRVRLDAEVLKVRRHQLGLSQEAFALACFERQLCVSIASVKRAETGKSLLLRTARHLAAFHGMDLHALLLPKADDAPLGEVGVGVGADVFDACPGARPESDPADARETFGRIEVLPADGRLVQVLCIWPVLEREREVVTQSVLGAGATLADAPTPDAVLGVFGLPRAQRSDVSRCTELAQRWAGRHVLISGGMWQAGSLSSPAASLVAWARRQSPACHVHRSVWSLLRGLHHLDAIPTQAAAGAGSVAADMARLGAPLKQVRRAFQLAGRQHEMRLFASLMQAVLADQQSQVMMVQGMAGMGKSRLLAEMMDTAQQHFMATVLVEIQDFGGDRHRAVFVSLLKSLLDLHDSTPFWAQLAAQRLQPLALPPEQMLVCKDLLALGLSPDERQLLQAMGHAARAQQMALLLARILTRMALQRPLLLVIEDVHWASVSTIETLARVISASQEAQVLWVLSSRVEAPHRLGELQRLIPDVAVTSLSLAPLRAPEVQDLARQFDHVDADWRQQCVQRAQGHPLFLTQLLMADRHTHLPDNFQHLLQVRLDDVSPQDRHALRLAAVLGQAFTPADIHTLMAAPQYQLDALVQHCLLRPMDGERYDFLHALIRQGVYEALPQRQREAMHAQVAAYFEPVDAALHAQHLHLARLPGAPAALLAAARARHELFDHEAALSLLQAYEDIDYAPRDDHAHALALGDVQAKMGQMPQARLAYERARQHAPDALSRLSATVALAGVLNVLEDLAAEDALIDAALPEAHAVGAQAQQAALHYLKGNLYFPKGDVARSREHHTQAMELARQAGAARLQAQALSGLGDSYYAEGLMATANEHFERCLQLCSAHGLRDIEASNRFMLATTQIYLCQTEAALREAVASAELARRVGNRRAEIVSRLTAGWVELGRGRPLEATAHIDEGLLIARAMGAMRFEPFLQESQARALFAQGDEAGAQRVIQAALDSVERLKLHAFIGPWVLGTWALLHHTDPAAVDALARGEALIAQGCVAHNVYRFHASAMEAHVLAGRHGAALAVGEAWLVRTGREPTPWVAGLHGFMQACAVASSSGQAAPQPDHPAWQALRAQQTLHVLLKLPRALLT